MHRYPHLSFRVYLHLHYISNSILFRFSYVWISTSSFQSLFFVYIVSVIRSYLGYQMHRYLHFSLRVYYIHHFSKFILFMVSHIHIFSEYIFIYIVAVIPFCLGYHMYRYMSFFLYIYCINVIVLAIFVTLC